MLCRWNQTMNFIIWVMWYISHTEMLQGFIRLELSLKKLYVQKNVIVLCVWTIFWQSTGPWISYAIRAFEKSLSSSCYHVCMVWTPLRLFTWFERSHSCRQLHTTSITLTEMDPQNGCCAFCGRKLPSQDMEKHILENHTFPTRHCGKCFQPMAEPEQHTCPEKLPDDLRHKYRSV